MNCFAKYKYIDVGRMRDLLQKHETNRDHHLRLIVEKLDRRLRDECISLAHLTLETVRRMMLEERFVEIGCDSAVARVFFILTGRRAEQESSSATAEHRTSTEATCPNKTTETQPVEEAELFK